jgi:hypothetical protein
VGLGPESVLCPGRRRAGQQLPGATLPRHRSTRPRGGSSPDARRRRLRTWGLRPVAEQILKGVAPGCSNQPAAPSNVASPPAMETSTAPADASASPQTAISALRFGNRTPGVVYVTSQGCTTTPLWSRTRCRCRAGSSCWRTDRPSSVRVNLDTWADDGGRTSI